MADNLTIQIGADATKLRAELEIAKAELRKFSIDARKESNAVVAAGGGVTPGLLAASANAERAAKHAAELRASMAGAHGEALSFSHRS